MRTGIFPLLFLLLCHIAMSQEHPPLPGFFSFLSSVFFSSVCRLFFSFFKSVWRKYSGRYFNTAGFIVVFPPFRFQAFTSFYLFPVMLFYSFLMRITFDV